MSKIGFKFPRVQRIKCNLYVNQLRLRNRSTYFQAYGYVISTICSPIDHGLLVDVNLIGATKVPIRESEQ